MGNSSSSIKNALKQSTEKATTELSATDHVIHETFNQSSAFEVLNNYRILNLVSTGAQTVREEQLTIEAFSHGSPISKAWNNWPEKLDNEPIFKYLSSACLGNSALKSLIQQYYKTSCAILFRRNEVDHHIIGSGSLILDEIYGYGYLISTARHNFQNVTDGHLFVRFYDYEVNLLENRCLGVLESYIDIPIQRRYNAHLGQDAGYLVMDRLKDENLFRKYCRALNVYPSSSLTDNMPDGKYAMFHFASGMHQISIGNISSPIGLSRLTENISIQAGSGASGAAILTTDISENIFACGISIYREMHSQGMWIERRIIPLNNFFKPVYIDTILAPYNYNPDFAVIPSCAFDESGYELLRWQREFSQIRCGKPDDKIYDVEEKQSVHHIIPIYDLLYLWNFFHTLDAETSLKKELEAKKTAESMYPAFSIARDPTLKKERENCKKELYKSLCLDEIKRRYGEYQDLIYTLCPNNIGRNRFAWAYWNLFIGPANRVDDPMHDGTYYEKNRPLRFNPSLWEALVGPTGLFLEIKKLKNVRTLSAFEAIQDSLRQSLYHIWNITRKVKTIHPFHSDEWDCVSLRPQPCYKVKQISESVSAHASSSAISRQSQSTYLKFRKQTVSVKESQWEDFILNPGNGGIPKCKR